MTQGTKNRTLDLKKLKAGGFIKERDKDLFTLRLRVPGGRLPIERLKKISDVARKYGADFVHLTVRQAIELVHINLDDFDAVTAELAEAGQEMASCGARVRVPTACGGCEYNPNGLVDTQKSAQEVDEKFFGIETGHGKFKVSFSGCPSDCPKSSTNDLGFIGAVWPSIDRDACLGCGLCVKTCSEGAIELDGDDRPVFRPQKCLYCGDCIKVCPADAWKEEKRGYSVYIGGKWGRRPMVGTLAAIFLPESEVVGFTREVLSWYIEKAEGLGRIRLGELLLKEGVDSLFNRLRDSYGESLYEQTGLPVVVGAQIRALHGIY